MPAAMHLTVLVSLLAVALCSEITTITSSGTTAVSTSTAQVTSSSISSTVETPISIPQPQTTAQQSTTETTTHQNTISISSTSPQKPKRTEETDPSPPPQTTTINQTSNETALPTVSTLPASESPNITGTTSINSTTTGFFPRQETGDLASNPGLVAIICIFCIVLTLALVVATLKCIQSPKSNFERLEDMPMGKVNEESPFAHYSK